MEEKLLKFHAILETEVVQMGYGTLSVNVVLVNGEPKVETLNIVVNKSLKFPINPTNTDDIASLV